MIPDMIRSFLLRSLTTSDRCVTKLLRRSAESEEPWRKHQDSSVSGTGWNAFQPDFQLKEQHAEDKFYDVLEEVPRVRKDLGEARWLLRLLRSLVHRLYLT